jgi:hypothetical protein
MKYKGQAIAIVLVLLILGAIIGFALYARAVREAERVVDEKAAAEANELTETIIGLIGMSDYERIKGDSVLEKLDCADDILRDVGCRKSGMTLSEVEELLEQMEVEGIDLSGFSADREESDDFCTTEIAMRFGMQDDEVTIEKDDTYSLFFGGIDWNTCNVSFVMSRNGAANGFVMSTFYGTHEASTLSVEKYKPYEHEDIQGFNYGSDSGNWKGYQSSIDGLSFPSVYSGFKSYESLIYALHEVRFKSLGDSSNLSWIVEGDGCVVENYLVMEVGSTCQGKYVGKRFLVPSEVFASAIFDYVLFNGQGELKPEKIERN